MTTAAFQIPEFQQNAFQSGVAAAFAFQKCSFQYGAFQVDTCTPLGQDGRSGYWRLFFTQLQEESDKKEEKEAASVPGAESVVLSKSVEAKPKKKPQRPTRTVEAPVEPVIKLQPLPDFTRQPLQPNPIIDSLRTAQEVRLMISQYARYTIQFTQPLDASNDEEDIELLLLVA